MFIFFLRLICPLTITCFIWPLHKLLHFQQCPPPTSSKQTLVKKTLHGKKKLTGSPVSLEDMYTDHILKTYVDHSILMVQACMFLNRSPNLLD